MLNLFAIAVENLGWHALAGAKKPLGALWPAGVWNPRIYIRPKPIFIARQLLPERHRALVGKGKADNRFDRLETIFPRRHQPDWCPVLVRQRLAVNAGSQKGQLILCLFNGQPLDIGPWVPALFLTGGDIRVHECFHSQIFGFGLWVCDFHQICQRHPRPGHSH